MADISPIARTDELPLKEMAIKARPVREVGIDPDTIHWERNRANRGRVARYNKRDLGKNHNRSTRIVKIFANSKALIGAA